MNRLIMYSILLLFILFSSACQWLQPKSQLPKDVPKVLDIRFASSTVYSNGDPRWTFRAITISGNEMKVEYNRCQTVKTATLDDKSIESLYQLFVKSEFDLIKEESATNDKSDDGFAEIYLKAGNLSKNVKKGNRFPLSETDRKHFNELFTRISEIARRNVGVGGCPD